jgi:hypothetical protein
MIGAGRLSEVFALSRDKVVKLDRLKFDGGLA